VSGNHPCWASVSLDRSGAHSLVSTEHARAGGRIVRWPLDESSGLPAVAADGQVHAREAFVSPVWGMQGATSHGGLFVIAGICPEYAGNSGDGVDYPSCLHTGAGGQGMRRWTRAPKNTQAVSYWPATGELWLHNEQLRERVVVHVAWPGTGRQGRPR
jgi:hypothetical protein